MKRHPLSFLLALALPLAGLSAVSAPVLAQPAPQETKAKGTPTAVDGRFQRYVVSPRGDLTALVLQDGTVVRVPPQAAQGPAGALKPGDALHVDGVASK